LKIAIRLLVSGIAFTIAAPAGAQTPSERALDVPAPLLAIYREEVRPGKAAAHAINETAWAAAFAKAQVPVHWLGMTSIAGPSEAWFLEAHDSYAAFEKMQQAVDGNAALRAESDRFSAADGELLSRSSTIIARYRPALSYQADYKRPDTRYMSVDVVRVKPGRVGQFTEVWREIVEAHKKSDMKEHWVVYQVETGMADATFLFLYPRKSLAEIDAAGPSHGAAAYRDAVGEGGRARSRAMNEAAVDFSQTYLFRLDPAMSTLPKNWSEADPFWNRPAAVSAQSGKGEKKK
jgi:hypothetical protein